jgi:hypothetical protein
MAELDAFGRAYLTMTLEIEKHVPGYVDAYYGPPGLKTEVEASDRKPAHALLDDLERLRDLVPAGDPHRRDYLLAVLRAMETTLRMQDGETFDYLEEVQRLYDISPQPAPESLFEAAHAELDDLLIARGSLVDRLEHWRRQFEIDSSRLLHVLEIARSETRKRTRQLVDLVEGEDIEIRLVNNQPWSAYNWYRGGARSLIEFNIDIPVSALDVLSLFAHEGYPGHHTEAQLKEKHLYEGKGYVEYAAALLHSPSAVIAEGIANTALEIIFPAEREAIEWMVDVILPEAKLPQFLPADIDRISKARRALRHVAGNAAIRYHRGELNEEQTLDYLRTYGLVSEKRARQQFSFMTNPLFRAYLFTYTEGYDLIEQAAGKDNKKPLFLRLLQEEVLPTQVARMAL